MGFDISVSDQKSFLTFQDYIGHEQPFIKTCRALGKAEKWLVKFDRRLNGHDGAVRFAYTCALYHLEKIRYLETELIRRIGKWDYATALSDGSTVGVGGTRICDFEFQAFILACRRCLDYLTRGLAAFFERDFDSFHQFPKKFKSLQPQNIASGLIEVQQKHQDNLATLMSLDGERSLRDRIAHSEWIVAAFVHIDKKGVLLHSGPEALRVNTGHNTPRLSQALAARLQILKSCIDEMMTVFVAEARVWEATYV